MTGYILIIKQGMGIFIEPDKLGRHVIMNHFKWCIISSLNAVILGVDGRLTALVSVGRADPTDPVAFTSRVLAESVPFKQDQFFASA